MAVSPSAGAAERERRGAEARPRAGPGRLGFPVAAGARPIVQRPGREFQAGQPRRSWPSSNKKPCQRAARSSRRARAPRGGARPRQPGGGTAPSHPHSPPAHPLKCIFRHRRPSTASAFHHTAVFWRERWREVFLMRRFKAPSTPEGPWPHWPASPSAKLSAPRPSAPRIRLSHQIRRPNNATMPPRAA